MVQSGGGSGSRVGGVLKRLRALSHGVGQSAKWGSRCDKIVAPLISRSQEYRVVARVLKAPSAFLRASISLVVFLLMGSLPRDTIDCVVIKEKSFKHSLAKKDASSSASYISSGASWGIFMCGMLHWMLIFACFSASIWASGMVEFLIFDEIVWELM